MTEKIEIITDSAKKQFEVTEEMQTRNERIIRYNSKQCRNSR